MRLNTAEIRYAVAGLATLAALLLLRGDQSSHPRAWMNPFTDILAQPDDITCGPTCVAMLLRHQGIDVTVDEVKVWTRTVWLRRDEGDVGLTVPAYIKDALEHYGLPAKMGHGSMDNLRHWVAMGRPCITLVRSSEYTWHYVVVVGYDEQSVFYANPSLGETRGLSLREFAAAWDWTGDLDGRECGPLARFIAGGLEVHPNCFVRAGD